MAITVGVNSYVTLAEAEIYFSERVEVDAWTSLPDDATKEKWLITAYKSLVNNNQLTLTGAETSQKVKDGQCEYALFLLENYSDHRLRDNLTAAGVKSFEYGERWKETLSGKTKLPDYILGFFEGYDESESAVAQLSV